MIRTLVEPGRYDGNWWLPAAPPEAKVPGTLVIGDDGSLELQLIGALSDELEQAEKVETDGEVSYQVTPASLTKSGVYPRILGEVGMSGYTLDDCFQVHRSGALFGGLQTQRIHVNQAFSRLHLEPDEKPEFSAIVVRLYGMQFFVAESGIGEALEFFEEQGGGGLRVTVNRLEARNLDTKKIAGVDGSDVTIEHAYTISGDRLTDRGFKQHFNVRVVSDGLAPLPELLGQVGILRDLVTVAINRPAAFEEVTLRHPDVATKIGEKVVSEVVGLASRWVVSRDEKRPATAHGVLFTLDELGGEDVVGGWMKAATEHASALSRVMTTRYSNSAHVIDNLMNCAASLEAYDREKHSDDIHYVERIKRCISHLGEPFRAFLGDADDWAKVLKDGRNAVAHHSAGVEGASAKQVFVSRSAFWLFILCLLKDAGAPDDLIVKVLAHGDLLWLKDQLAAVMET